MINALGTLLTNGLLLYVVCSDEASSVAAHIRESGSQIGCVVTSPSTFDRDTGMLSSRSTMPAPVSLSELSWPNGVDLEDLVVTTWSTDAAEAVAAVLEVVEMEPTSLVVVVCENKRLTKGLAEAIMSAITVETPQSPSASGLLSVTEMNISGGGPAFILCMKPKV